MLNRCTFLLICLSLSLCLRPQRGFAAGPGPNSKTDTVFLNLKQISEKTKKFTKPTVLSGDFEQTKVLQEMGVSLKTSGQFKMYRQSKVQATVVWQIKIPEPLNICINDQDISFEQPVQKKKNKMKISDISQQDSSGLSKLLYLIKLNPEDIEKNFNVTEKNKILQITPKVKNEYSFQKADIELDAQQNIKKIDLLESSQDQMKISFLHIKESPLKNHTAEEDCN